MSCAAVRRARASGASSQSATREAPGAVARSAAAPGAPKTISSVREVPLPRFVQDAITDHVEELQLAPDQILCRTPRGNLVRRDYYNRKIWRPAIDAAGLPDDTTFHDLRHTFASTARLKECPFLRFLTGWAANRSLQPSTCTGTLFLRQLAGHVTLWTELSCQAMCPRCAPGSQAATKQRRSAAWAAGESACRPGSVRPLARAGGHPSRTAVAGSLMRSTREHRAGRPQSLAQERTVTGAAPS